MVALPHPVALGDDDALGLFFRTAHVGIEFGAFHRSVAMYGIHLPVVVEEHAQVVDVSLHVVMLPRTADVAGGIALQSLAVDVGEDIELSVGIADTWCPDALTVNLLMVLQRETVVGEVEAVEAIGDVLPVDEVLGVEDNQSGNGMHGGACQIVVVAHPQDVGVAELIVEQGVGERPVAIVGSP